MKKDIQCPSNAPAMPPNAQLLEQYRLALDSASIVSKTDAKGNITYVNARFEDISGYTQAELLGKNHNILRHPDMPTQVFKELWQTITHKKVWQGRITNRKKEGSSYTVNSFVVPILDDTGKITEYISIRNDITELLNQQKMIEQQKLDRLTNLPSRNALLMDIEKESLSMLAILDIRHFRLFNDFYGIDFADKILIEVANWLNDFSRTYHLKVYRICGARFAITADSMSTQTVAQFKQALQHLWISIEEEHFELNHDSIDLDVLIGIGLGERHLLPLAEAALTHAKHNLKGKQIALFDEQSAQQQDHLKWIHHIRNALNDGRIVNYYQPIVNPNNPAEIKYEALVRLVQKDGTVVSPFYFLDIAKKTRYYNQITRTVFKQALAFSCQKKVQVSVNLSIEDIENKTLRDDILSQLATHQTARITLEITESESIQDYAIMKQFVQDVHGCGAQVAIDDFGSGYSNFSYLVEMQADYLKIDGSIIKKILTDSNSLLVIESIIDIARKLGIKVVAEFVSEKAIADKLNWMGVDYLQGYYYGAPQAME
jgi:PAS domain S-box-containing protein